MRAASSSLCLVLLSQVRSVKSGGQAPRLQSEREPRRSFTTMRNRAISPVATILSVLLLAFVASPAQAGPVAYSEVVHVMGNLRSGGQSQELRLRSFSQEGATHVNGSLVSASKSSTDISSAATSEPTSLISTSTGSQEGQQGSV